MEAPSICNRIRPLSPSPVIVTGTPTENTTKIPNRLKGSNRNEEKRSRFGSRLHGRHRFNNSCSSSDINLSRSLHPSSAVGGGESSRTASGRPLSANYALRPLPPPPPPPPLPPPMPPRYHFGCLLRNNLPPMPPSLIAKTNLTGSSRAAHFANSKAPYSAGNVKVILCVKAPSASSNEGASATSCLSIDPRRKQITLVHPVSSRPLFSLSASKIFNFGAVFTSNDNLIEICSAALTDAVFSVVNGIDSCVLCFGHAKTSKSRTMIGSDASAASIGVIPCAIAWLFRLIEERKKTTKTRFSVRVSAVEVFGSDESFKDLLQESALHGENDHLPGPPPSSYLRDTNPNFQTWSMSTKNSGSGSTPAARLSATMDKLTEIRASTAGHAAHLLDVALATRAQNEAISHTLFTLHVYQYSVKKNGTETEVSGGRSRLQLLYLGCGRYGLKNIGQDKQLTAKSLSLANIANVLLGLLTGQRQLPHRESAVTQLLREGMSGIRQPCIIAHASGQLQHYTETLQVVQLASKLHRLRRRRVGSTGGSSAGESGWITAGSTTSDSSVSSRGFHPDIPVRPRLGRSSFGTSTTDYTSSSEQSCAGDTVIYLGSGARKIKSMLGPRGMADGSVVHSADELKQYASSGEEGTLQQFESKTRLVRSIFQSESGSTLRSGGLIKRVTPRTNVIAWPRVTAVRKGKEVVNSTKETWVDGPNVMMKEQQNAHSDAQSIIRSDDTPPPPPAPPYFGVTHHIIPQRPNQNSDSAKVTEVLLEPIAKAITPVEVNIKEPAYASIDEINGRVNGINSASESCTSSSSDGEGNANNQAKTQSAGGADGVCASGTGDRDFGVLSDISERTEETEGGTSAPSSVAGGGQEERENTILDLAIQQSSLARQDDNEIVGDAKPLSWCPTDKLHENPPTYRLQPPPILPQFKHESPEQRKPTSSIAKSSPVHQSNQATEPLEFANTSAPTDDPVNELKAGRSASERSRKSVSKKNHPITTSSSDRVAAWVKEVSNDLDQMKEQDHSSELPSHLCLEKRSSSHHRKTRLNRYHHRHHRHHHHRRSTCSKCEPDTCAICEVVGKCCSRVCRGCTYCDGGHMSDNRPISEPSICRPILKVATKSHEPALFEKSLQRHPVTQRSLSVSPIPVVIQRTVSFPRLPTKSSKSFTTHSTPCQTTPSAQPMRVSQGHAAQFTPTQYCCSYPNPMQAWPTDLLLSPLVAINHSQIMPSLQYANERRRRCSEQEGTPVHNLPPPQDPKKSKFFTLPSILSTLLRWHARKKNIRTRKQSATETEREADGSELVMTIPLQANASLPSAYSHTAFSPTPGSNQDLDYAQNHYYPWPMVPPLQYPGIHQLTPHLCASDPSVFMSQIHQSLSTYRTSRRPGGVRHRDKNRGDRGSSSSSSYESCRQDIVEGSSEVSSSHTDSVDSCSSSCQHHGVYCPNQRFFSSHSCIPRHTH